MKQYIICSSFLLINLSLLSCVNINSLNNDDHDTQYVENNLAIVSKNIILFYKNSIGMTIILKI